MISDFMRGLPRLNEDESFCFDCHPGVSCFNSCCADLDLVLSPYDVLRLRNALGIGAAEFLERFAEVEVPPGGGLPRVFLKMREDQRKTCPFVEESGCSVYADRPGACRTYPLGRGASVDSQGRVQTQYVLVREKHCRGFEEPRSWKAESWMQDQGLKAYISFSDKYLELAIRCNQLGGLTREQFTDVLNDLYQADDPTLALEKVRGYLLSTPRNPG